MTEDKFLSELKKSLRGLNHHEIDDILADYKEHFRVAAAEGKSEETVAAALGNPRILGKSFRIEARLQNHGKKPGIRDFLSVFVVSLSLGFFNIIFAAGPFFGFVAILLSLWAISAGLSLSGILLGIYAIVCRFIPGAPGLSGLNVPFLVFSALGCTSLGLLCSIGMVYLTRIVVKGFIRYLRLNANLIIRKKELNHETD